ncbi:MAG: M48 family metallopeptidase [Congregibacter sp.]
MSHEHPLREFFILLIGATAALLLILYLSGLLVDKAVQYVDPELESTLFKTFAGDDAPRSEKEMELQALVDQLAECIDVTYAVRVRIQQSEELNAFAMPGGQMIILSAVLEQLQTENGVAFVLAHELGHFKNRDHLRGMGRSIVLLAFSSLVTGSNSGLTSFLTPVVSAQTASYSRGRESLADATALNALNCHYGSVQDATEFFELMASEENQERVETRKWTHYFASHPEAQQRVRDLSKLATDLGYAGLAKQ